MAKKITIIAVIIIVLGAGLFFGWKKYGSAKKINVTPSIAEIETNQNNQSADVQSSDPQTISESSDNPLPADDAKQNSPDTNTQNNKTTNTSDNVQVKPTAGIVSRLVSWGFQKSSGRTIKAVIIHTSYNAIGGDVFEFSKVMQEWKEAGVSPHYAIDRDGTIYQLVADQNIAWHAGASKLPDGTTDVNGASIGVEVVNDQDSKFTAAQYAALNRLIGDLKKKYPIKYVLGHDDIAPGRKTDPWGIEWLKVAR